MTTTILRDALTAAIAALEDAGTIGCTNDYASQIAKARAALVTADAEGAGELTLAAQAMEADAQAFEKTLPMKARRVPSTVYPWGWRYHDPLVQKGLLAWCQGSRPAPVGAVPAPEDTKHATCPGCNGLGVWVGGHDGYDDADCFQCGGVGKVAAAPAAPIGEATALYEEMRIALVIQIHSLIDVAERSLWRKEDEDEVKRTQGAIDHARKVSDPYNYNGTGPITRHPVAEHAKPEPVEQVATQAAAESVLNQSLAAGGEHFGQQQVAGVEQAKLAEGARERKQFDEWIAQERPAAFLAIEGGTASDDLKAEWLSLLTGYLAGLKRGQQAGAVDGARLDFIDARPLHVQTCYTESSDEPVYEICIVHGPIEHDSLQCIGTGATLREAIDKARAASANQKGE